MESSAAIEYRKSDADVAEPFGQAGIRQHVGKVYLSLLIVGLIASCGLWLRSESAFDWINWREQTSDFSIVSGAGRVRFELNFFSSPLPGSSGWDINSRPIGGTRQFRDAWRESIFKTIGIEARFSPMNNNATNGMWIRAKWYFVTGVLAFLLLLHLLLRWRHTRRSNT